MCRWGDCNEEPGGRPGEDGGEAQFAYLLHRPGTREGERQPGKFIFSFNSIQFITIKFIIYQPYSRQVTLQLSPGRVAF